MWSPDGSDASSLPEEASALLRQREAATASVPGLLAALREEIALRGPITFERFMEVALYHPTSGYYASPDVRIGPDGDFMTSPEVSPIFGTCVANALARIAHEMRLPEPWSVVEAGPGSGRLALDILTAMRHLGSHPPPYTLVEPNPHNAARQRRLLADAGLSANVRWVRSLRALRRGAVNGFILANELLDALPVHRVTMLNGQLREVYTGLSDGRFVDVHGPPSSPALATYLRRAGVSLADGQAAEVNLRAVRWLRQAAARLASGAILLIDYGYPTAILYSGRFFRGTLICYHRHVPSENPYVRVGRQDITAHVDFGTLALRGARLGLRPDELVSQREFLLAHGAADLARTPLQRRELDELTAPDGLGRLKLLLMRRRA